MCLATLEYLATSKGSRTPETLGANRCTRFVLGTLPSNTTPRPLSPTPRATGADLAAARTYGPDLAAARATGADLAAARTYGPDLAAARTYGPDLAAARTYGPDLAAARTYGPDRTEHGGV